MEPILADLAAQHAALRDILDGCEAADWELPTRCEGWDVADVVLHLAQTDELAAASALGRLGGGQTDFFGLRHEAALSVDEAAATQVAVERELGGGAIRERWRASSVALLETLRNGDPHARVMWVAGQLSLQTLVATRLSECWIHTGDVANALGFEPAPTDRLRHIARLAWRTLPYAFEQAGSQLQGPVAIDLIGPRGDLWQFLPDGQPVTTVTGPASEFCEVAARRRKPADSQLVCTGPDGNRVLELVRTYAQ